jgi:hypothetical protein
MAVDSINLETNVLDSTNCNYLPDSVCTYPHSHNMIYTMYTLHGPRPRAHVWYALCILYDTVDMGAYRPSRGAMCMIGIGYDPRQISDKHLSA